MRAALSDVSDVVCRDQKLAVPAVVEEIVWLVWLSTERKPAFVPAKATRVRIGFQAEDSSGFGDSRWLRVLPKEKDTGCKGNNWLKRKTCAYIF